jgi:membrane protein implicated in regulation of membrane protease activity
VCRNADGADRTVTQAAVMTKPETSRKLRRGAALTGEFIFVAGVFFAFAGIAVVILGGPVPKSIGGIVFFASVVVIALIHHRWYSRNKEEIEASPEQKAQRERRGY